MTCCPPPWVTHTHLAAPRTCHSYEAYHVAVNKPRTRTRRARTVTATYPYLDAAPRHLALLAARIVGTTLVAHVSYSTVARGSDGATFYGPGRPAQISDCKLWISTKSIARDEDSCKSVHGLGCEGGPRVSRSCGLLSAALGHGVFAIQSDFHSRLGL